MNIAICDNEEMFVKNISGLLEEYLNENKAGELSDDEAKNLEDDVQKLTDKYIALIDKAIEEKTSEILTV
jgi:ribosome recycling factor